MRKLWTDDKCVEGLGAHQALQGSPDFDLCAAVERWSEIPPGPAHERLERNQDQKVPVGKYEQIRRCIRGERLNEKSALSRELMGFHLPFVMLSPKIGWSNDLKMP